MTEQEYNSIKQVLADAPDQTAITVANYDYGDCMHLLYLNCENEFYDSDEKHWVKMCLVDNYFHSYRRLSDLRTMVEQYEENQQLKAKVAELELDVISRDLLLQSQEDKIAELENTLAKCERVIKVPDNTNTADDYDLGA